MGGLYQGFQAGLASSALGCGLGFTTYEALTVAYRNSLQRAPTPSERGTLAGCAAFCTISACMPLEVIMRRLQARLHGAQLPGRTTESDLPAWIWQTHAYNFKACMCRGRALSQISVSHVPGVPVTPSSLAPRADMQCSQCSACTCLHLQAFLMCRCKAARATPCYTAARWTALSRLRRQRACAAFIGLIRTPRLLHFGLFLP